MLQGSSVAGLGGSEWRSGALDEVVGILEACAYPGRRGAGRGFKVRDVFGAMHICLMDPYQSPQYGSTPWGRVGRYPGMRVTQLAITHERGGAIDMQSDVVSGEVHEQQTYVRVFGDVACAGEDAVTAVLGVYHGPLVQNGDKAGGTCTERGVTVSAGVRGGEEDHGLTVNEVTHGRGEMCVHLPVIEGVCPLLGAKSGLEPALSVRGSGFVARHR
jgi:hypothetical protein